MNVIYLNEKEQHTYNIIKKVVNNEMTRKEVMFELNKSRQQVYRLIEIYKTEGIHGFAHKNRGKENSNKISESIIDEIKQLYLTKYYDYNFEHFFEEIKDEYNISYPSLHKKFFDDDIISPLAHKETIRLYNEKMKNAIENNDKNISEEKIELFQTRQIAFEKAHTRRANNLYSFGEEIQMDGCEENWFGGIKSCLHLVVDKATKKVLFGWFEYEELTRGYMILLYNTIINYGIPKRIKADNRNSFSNNKNKVNTTQFGMICIELGIELVTTSNPTGKSNIERENKTFKNRLIAELRHEGITDIDEANKYLTLK